MNKKKITLFLLAGCILASVFCINKYVVEGAFNKEQKVVIEEEKKIEESVNKVKESKNESDIKQSYIDEFEFRSGDLDENLRRINSIDPLSNTLQNAQAVNWLDNNRIFMTLEQNNIDFKSDNIKDIGKVDFLIYDTEKEKLANVDGVNLSCQGSYLSPNNDMLLVNNVSSYYPEYTGKKAGQQYYVGNYIYDIKNENVINIKDKSEYRYWLSNGNVVFGTKIEDYNSQSPEIISLNIFDIKSKKEKEIIKSEDIIQHLENEYERVCDMYYIDDKSKIIAIVKNEEKEDMMLIDLNNLSNYKKIHSVKNHFCMSFHRFNDKYIKFTGILNDDLMTDGNLEYLIDVENGEIVCTGEFIEKYKEDKIAYKEQNGYIILKDLNNNISQKLRLGKNVNSISFSKDGKRMAYWSKTSDTSEIRLADIENGFTLKDGLLLKLNNRDEPKLMINEEGNLLLANGVYNYQRKSRGSYLLGLRAVEEYN